MCQAGLCVSALAHINGLLCLRDFGKVIHRRALAGENALKRAPALALGI